MLNVIFTVQTKPVQFIYDFPNVKRKMNIIDVWV